MLAVGPPRSEITPEKPGGLVAHPLDLAQHRGLGAVLDDAPLVFGDRAERAAAEAAAHDRHRRLDHVVGGDLGPRRSAGGAGGCRAARRRRPSRRVVSGSGRRVQPDVAIAVRAAPAPGRSRGWTPGAGCARRGRTARRRPRPPRRTAGGSPSARAAIAAASPAARRRASAAGAVAVVAGRGRRRLGGVRIDGRGRGPGVSTSRRVDLREPRRRRAAAGGRTPSPGCRPARATGSPAASRRAISTTCRSPLPYTSRSALASSRIERRTFSDQ